MDISGDVVIDIKKLNKSYRGVDALKDLDLQVRRHSIFGFLGPNGAGKSTTIKILLGLTKPTSGKASIFGMDAISESISIRRRIGYLAQDPRYYEQMTARQVLRFTAGFFYSGAERAIEQRVAETLDLVGLSSKADRPIRGFSGGERQRLGIAQAQINHPDLLILDEPAAALDPMGRRDVLDVMQRLREQTTIFYSTHILEDVQRVSDSVAILNRGELVAQAPIQELLSNTGSIAYTVRLRGNVQGAYERVVHQPWVIGIDARLVNDATTWRVRVTDETAAEAQLLPLLVSAEDVRISDFGRQKRNLEEIFIQMVEGEQQI